MAGSPIPELGYPRLMTEILPHGLLGFCLVGLLSAFMSTVSTLFNLSPSYLVNDIYKAFFVPHASQRHYVLVSRIATALIAGTGMILSLYIESIADMWQFVLSFASGAGIVWILRWFWWRINAWSEFSSMICSAVVATYLKRVHPEVPFENALLIIVALTTPVCLLVTYLTQPVEDETLRDFYNKVQPGQWGWRRIAEKYGIARTPFLTRAFVNFVLGTALLFLINFGVGTLLLRSLWLGVGEIALGSVIAVILVKRIQKDDLPQAPEKVALPGRAENLEDHVQDNPVAHLIAGVAMPGGHHLGLNGITGRGPDQFADLAQPGVPGESAPFPAQCSDPLPETP